MNFPTGKVIIPFTVTSLERCIKPGSESDWCCLNDVNADVALSKASRKLIFLQIFTVNSFCLRSKTASLHLLSMFVPQLTC